MGSHFADFGRFSPPEAPKLASPEYGRTWWALHHTSNERWRVDLIVGIVGGGTIVALGMEMGGPLVQTLRVKFISTVQVGRPGQFWCL